MLLLAAALLVRAVIPQGYMVESARPGGLTVTICHSDKVWQIPLEKNHMKHGKQSHGDPQPCAFAAMGAATPPADVAMLPLPEAVAGSFVSNEASFALRNTERQRPPARGPPAFA